MVDKQMMKEGNSILLRNDSYEIQLMRNLYDSAVKQLSLKFEILNNEFKVLYARNPIHHIEGRVKATESNAAKLQKKGLPLTVEAARENQRHRWRQSGMQLYRRCVSGGGNAGAPDGYRDRQAAGLYSVHPTTMATARCIWISVCRCICQTGLHTGQPSP